MFLFKLYDYKPQKHLIVVASVLPVGGAGRLTGKSFRAREVEGLRDMPSISRDVTGRLG